MRWLARSRGRVGLLAGVGAVAAAAKENSRARLTTRAQERGSLTDDGASRIDANHPGSREGLTTRAGELTFGLGG